MLKNSIFSRRILPVFLTGLLGFNSVPVRAGHDVAAANIKVVQLDEANTASSVKATTTLSIHEFSLRPGSNRGDYNVQIGAGFSDDVEGGALMTCVAENGRNNNETNYPGTNFCTSAIDYTRGGATDGSFYIPVANAPVGVEFNINVAAAFFPYTTWLGGYARNSGNTNGGANNLLSGSPGLFLGTHFVDKGNGTSTVNLKSFGIDSRKDGVLLVTAGRNEDNYALSKVNSDGTWTVYVKDNGSDADAYEQDPVAFVFIPKTNTTVISGRFEADGTRSFFSGSTPAFNITNIGTGQWRLTIPGQSPSTGVLIVSPEGGLTFNQDNIVSYQPDGNGWIIQSRDLPPNPPALQTPIGQPVASFVFIPAPPSIASVSPANNSSNQLASTMLKLSISNAVPGQFKVQFFGRPAVTNIGSDFAIALLPDTQYYTAERFGGKKEMFIAQTEWIITNRVARNIAYVAQLGDISDSGDIKGTGPNTTEWRNATNAMYRLENPTRTLLQYGVPYGVAVGNHDEEPINDPNGTTIFYNQYFGVSRFLGRPYYAGHYGTNNNNHFDFFSAGGMDFVVLYFAYDPAANPAVLAWGNEVLRSNPNRRAIVVSHGLGNTQTPLNFSAQGAAIFNALKTNANLFLMLAGHVTGEGSRVDTYDGRIVRTFVQDFQSWTNGGNGFMRTMDFSPANNQVVVQTFSPWTGEYETDEDSEFFFDYDMQPTNSAPFELIGTLNNVFSGAIASVTWSNREPGSVYEWYAVVTDSLGNTNSSPKRRFKTVTNSAPVVTNRVITVIGDSPTNLTLFASDANGDALTFKTNSWPAHGLNLNFNANNGTLTYLPTHGFRGLDQFSFSASDGFANSSVGTVFLSVVSPPDNNGNGIPDAWETAYGITDPNADNDGDGQSNLEEFLANTNPTNAASCLKITGAVRAQNGQVTLTWASVGGSRYRVQYSNADANGSFNGVFSDIVRPIEIEMDSAPNNSPSSQSFLDDFTLTGPATNKARFYRIKVVQ